MRYKRIGYNVDVMRQSACLVVNPITVNNFVVLFLLHAGGSGFRFYDSPNIKISIWLAWAGHLSVSWPIEVLLLQWCC